MAAYSFQERFIPFIEDGSKNCTVRALRFGRTPHVKPGGTMQLYCGLRTKQCRKIGEATCCELQRILINKVGIFLSSYFGEDSELNTLWVPLHEIGCERFAWRDGFRPEGSTLDNPAGAFDLMARYISKAYGLPFEGVVIFWSEFRLAK